MKKQIMSFALATMMTVSMMGTPALATESENGSSQFAALEPVVTATQVNGLTVEETAPLDLSGIDPSNIIELPDTQIATYAADSEPAPEINKTGRLSISTASLTDAENLDSYAVNSYSVARTANYNLFSLSDVMGADKEMELYSITVPAGDIVQAELQIPKNLSLDYTLHLCTFDENTSNLMIESSSSYTTNSLFMPESVCTINNSNSSVVYYIVIVANGNPGTADPYTLTVSYGGSPDDFEPNDSAFSAFAFPEMSNTTTITVPGSLHTPIDNDWFELYVPNTTSFAGLIIDGVPDNAVVESYKFTSGSQPVLTGSTANGKTLPVTAGYNYFRIAYNKNGAFSDRTYNIKFTPALTPQKLVTLIAVNGYCQRKSSLFNDRVTRYLFIRGANVQVKVLYATENNIMVPVNDTVNVEIENPQWDNPSMRYHTGSTTIRNEDTCIVNLTAPTTYGVVKYNFVYTTITSSNYGTIANSVQMALLDHYDDGELNRPCDHNGTCGYM